MGEQIELTASDGHVLRGWQAKPEHPVGRALVVIQEIFGVNEHIRKVCDGFAADGYHVVAPALFDRIAPGLELGYSADDVSRGRELRAQIDWEQAVADVSAAFQATADLPTGVVGYCWGGSLAWLAATRLQPVVAVGYYGGQIIDFVKEQPRCPTMLHFGEQDTGIPMSDVEVVRAEHADVLIHTYTAGHGFSCDARGSFDADSAGVARQRSMDFFAQHFGS